jgi:hypothetical protein
MVAWLDQERLIVRDDRGISVIRLDGTRRELMRIGGYFIGRSMGLSRDRRWITYTETGTQGDIWLATIR